jgi:two-component system, NtrC family, response regulator
MADGPRITPEDLGLEAPAAGTEELPGLREARDNAEQEAVIRAMGRCNDNIAHAADLLGITRPTLYNLLDKFGLRKANEQDDSPP